MARTDHDPPPNYSVWKCPSCGAGVEAIEIRERSVTTFRFTMNGDTHYRWEQVAVEPDHDVAEAFKCGNCGEEIKDENGNVICNASDFGAYLNDAVIQIEALELLDRLAPSPTQPKEIA